jgi:hypothetical protein
MEVDDREELRLLGILYHSANTIETRAAQHANKKSKTIPNDKLVPTVKVPTQFICLINLQSSSSVNSLDII